MHPGVQILSRDRSSEYARAARQVAPQVVQVADRFHLIHNLREALFRLFRRHGRLLRQVTSPRRREGQPESVTHWRLDREASHERDRAAMEERFYAIHLIAKQRPNRPNQNASFGTSRVLDSLGLADRLHFVRWHNDFQSLASAWAEGSGHVPFSSGIMV